MNEPKMLSPGDQRTRRNIMKMGAIVTSAIVANLTMTKTGAADPGGNGHGHDQGGGHCLLKGTRSNRPRRSENRRPGDRRFGADDVLRIASHSVDRALSIKEG